MKAFGERLKELREEQGLSRKDFAHKLNVPPRTLRSWEAGDRIPSVETARQIAIALACDANYLLGLVD